MEQLPDICLKIGVSNELLHMQNMFAFKDSSVLAMRLVDEETLSNLLELKIGYKIADSMLVKLLIMLDTIAYVPFGKRGMKALEEILSKFDGSPNSVKFKIDKMMSALQDNKVEICDELKSIVEKFCQQYIGSIFDLSDPISFAALVRRLNCELENSIVSGFINGKIPSDVFEELLEQIFQDTNEENRLINLDDYISKRTNDDNLDEDQIKYLKKITKTAFLGK